MQDEDQPAVRIEKSERDAFHSHGFGGKDTVPAILAAAGVALLQGALDEPSPREARPDVGGGGQDRRLSGGRHVRP